MTIFWNSLLAIPLDSNWNIAFTIFGFGSLVIAVIVLASNGEDYSAATKETETGNRDKKYLRYQHNKLVRGFKWVVGFVFSGILMILIKAYTIWIMALVVLVVCLDLVVMFLLWLAKNALFALKNLKFK